jgi:hypothetical protein
MNVIKSTKQQINMEANMLRALLLTHTCYVKLCDLEQICTENKLNFNYNSMKQEIFKMEQDMIRDILQQ